MGHRLGRHARIHWHARRHQPVEDNFSPSFDTHFFLDCIHMYSDCPEASQSSMGQGPWLWGRYLLRTNSELRTRVRCIVRIVSMFVTGLAHRGSGRMVCKRIRLCQWTRQPLPSDLTESMQISTLVVLGATSAPSLAGADSPGRACAVESFFFLCIFVVRVSRFQFCIGHGCGSGKGE